MRRAGVGLVVAAAVAAGASSAGAVQGTVPNGAAAAATVRIEVGTSLRACSGALLSERWVVTAASCFAESPQEKLRDGAPARTVTATIGRTDLTGTAGQVVVVDQLVPHPERDVVLARLATAVTTVAPVPVASAAPTGGQRLTVTGYGRTTSQVVPDTAHAATFTVGAVSDGYIDIEAVDTGATICKGDAGGPALRSTSNGGVELVAIHGTAHQGGCLGSAATRQGATETRVDDIRSWISSITHPRQVCAPLPGAPSPSPVPDGRLVRTPDGTIYVVAGGAKFPLSYKQWESMGLRPYTEVSAATAAALGDVPRNPTLLRDMVTGSIYQVVNGARYGLSMTEWKAMGYPGYVDVPAGFIDRTADAAPAGPIILRDPVTSAIHQVVGCARYQLSAQQWQALGNPAYVNAPGAFIARIPTGAPSGAAILREPTTGSIYQVVGRAKYGLTLVEWQGLGTPAYTEVPAGLIAQITGSVPDGPVLLRDKVTGGIVEVAGGSKRGLSLQQWQALENRSYTEVPAGWLARIPDVVRLG